MTFPLLRCPHCGYSYRPAMHGWAFKTDARTRCQGRPDTPRPRESSRHPFEIVEEDPRG